MPVSAGGYPVINTPRGTIIVKDNMTAKLTWNPGFKAYRQNQFMNGQQFVDSEILRLCEPYIPKLTGMLILSGILGTMVGSGWIKWIAPYASKQYYLENRRPSQTGAQRGSFWFQRMKQSHGRSILNGAARVMGARSAKWSK